jgi:acyl-homoserine lactone synthase
MLSAVANALLSGIVERGLRKGADMITIGTNRFWLVGLAQLHLRVTPLGLPRTIGNEQTLAVNASFDKRTVAGARDVWKASPRLAQPTIEACKVA